MDDVADRLADRIQLTSDGHKAYLDAVEGAFGADIDYAMLVKLYGAAPDGAKGRYSPAECIGARKERIEGKPDMTHVSTSYAERANLTMRMHNRRFTRLTNAFSQEIREPRAHGRDLCRLVQLFVFTRRFASRPRWPLASLTTVMDWSDIIVLMDADGAAALRASSYFRLAIIKLRHYQNYELLDGVLSSLISTFLTGVGSCSDLGLVGFGTCGKTGSCT